MATVHYRLGRAYRRAGLLEEALLSFREAFRLDPELHWAHMGLLDVLLQLEQWAEVVQICRGMIHFEGELPWVYCFMGNALAKQGNIEEAAACHQKSFALQGWSQCAERDYQFSQTRFSERISLWKRHLLPLVESTEKSAEDSTEKSLTESPTNVSANLQYTPIATKPPLWVLSLGSDDGSSLCWLVDTLLQSADDRLLCMTTRAGKKLKDNSAKLTDSHKLILQTGDLFEQLGSFDTLETFEKLEIFEKGNQNSDEHLKQEPSSQDSFPRTSEIQTSEKQALEDAEPSAQFGIIYLQSRVKTGDYLNALAAKAWPLLRTGGVMIFSNYRWRAPSQPENASKVGIDSFIASVAGQVKVLHRSHQVIISKKGQL